MPGTMCTSITGTDDVCLREGVLQDYRHAADTQVPHVNLVGDGRDNGGRCFDLEPLLQIRRAVARVGEDGQGAKWYSSSPRADRRC